MEKETQRRLRQIGPALRDCGPRRAECRLLAAGLGLLVAFSAGCASSGEINTSRRPSFGKLPFGQAPYSHLRQSPAGPVIQPGTGLNPTPLLPDRPSIQPGPALPDARGHRIPIRPRSSVRVPRKNRNGLPAVIPRTAPGGPVATDTTPAELNGGIEIIPGTTIRARRARVEELPAPPDGSSSADARIPDSLSGRRFEELPAPD